MKSSAATITDDVSSFALPGLDTGQVPAELLLTESDKTVLKHFDETVKTLAALLEKLAELEGRLPIPEAEMIRHARESVVRAIELNVAGIFRHDVEQMQTVYEHRLELNKLFVELIAAHDRLNEVVSSFSYRAFRGVEKFFAAGHKWKRFFSPGSATSSAAQPANVHAQHHRYFHYDVQSPYADVDNTGTAFEIFRNWVSLFHTARGRYGSKNPTVHDQLPILLDLNRRMPLQGKRVLELGALEGANTKQLLDLGAAQVTAIESNRESFIKCLIARNELELDRARFIFGDLNEVLLRPEFAQEPHFDLCFASGVLYHLEDPVRAIDLIVSTARAVYVWSQVANKQMPQGDWLELFDSQGRRYRGRRNHYKQTDVLGGLGGSAIWLTLDSLERAFTDRGFTLQSLEDVTNCRGDVAHFLATRV